MIGAAVTGGCFGCGTAVTGAAVTGAAVTGAAVPIEIGTAVTGAAVAGGKGAEVKGAAVTVWSFTTRNTRKGEAGGTIFSRLETAWNDQTNNPSNYLVGR